MTEILSQISTAVIEGRHEQVEAMTRQALGQGHGAQDILDNGLMPGMDHVGVEFRAGNMFVPEVLRSARAMQTAMDVLRPLLADTDARTNGRILLGTVKGDLHDIGKNLVAMMCEGAGFEVKDLGKNIAPETFVEEVKAFNPDILGMSALLTTTMRTMEATIKALEEAGVRDRVKVIIGGAPVTQTFADQIGADGYASNAAPRDLARGWSALIKGEPIENQLQSQLRRPFRAAVRDQPRLFECASWLEYTGLDVQHEEARDILKKAGAWVEGERVRIPSYIVRDALDKAPRSFTLWARDGNPKHNIHIGPGRAHFGPGPTCVNFIDPDTMERRPYVKSDVPTVARIVDALDYIDFCESLGTVGDVHHDLGALYEFAGMFPNTSKPIVAWSYDWHDSAGIHQIAVAEAGGQLAFEKRPNYVHYCEPLSPLVSTFEALDKLIFAAKHRVPLVFTPCPLAGGTAPITAAGIIIQAAAESWMGLTIAQQLAPGLPFFMGGVLSVMDMSAMILAYGAPELSLFMAGITELAHFAGLPLWQTGGCTDSKTFDGQAMIEARCPASSPPSRVDLTHDGLHRERHDRLRLPAVAMNGPSAMPAASRAASK